MGEGTRTRECGERKKTFRKKKGGKKPKKLKIITKNEEREARAKRATATTRVGGETRGKETKERWQ